MKCKGNSRKMSAAGFTLIEVLIALAILSIGIMAITSAGISAAGNSRNTVCSDMVIMHGQKVMEEMAALPPDASSMSDGVDIIPIVNGRIEREVFGAADVNNDGRDDYITIVTRVFVEKGGRHELRLESVLRRSL